MKILIADDESLVRQSIRLFWLELGIQPTFSVVKSTEGTGDGSEGTVILQ